MSRRTDLIQQLIRSDKFGDEKDNEQKFLAATAELILTDLINIAINGVNSKGAGSLIINLINDSTVFMSGHDIEKDFDIDFDAKPGYINVSDRKKEDKK